MKARGAVHSGYYGKPCNAADAPLLATLRDRADFPSCGVVASLLGSTQTSSAPPCLREICRVAPRRILRQAPNVETAQNSRGLNELKRPEGQVRQPPGLCSARSRYRE